jgi:hypothetical protein
VITSEQFVGGPHIVLQVDLKSSPSGQIVIPLLYSALADLMRLVLSVKALTAPVCASFAQYPLFLLLP